MTQRLEDLEFIKEVLNQLVVDVENIDFGPSVGLAEANKKLALVKLNRLIREEKLNLRQT